MRRAAAVLFAIVGAACGEEPLEPLDTSAAVETGALVSGQSEMAAVLTPLEAPDILETTSIALAPQVAAESIEALFRAEVGLDACLTVDTDLSSFIDITFNNCGLGRFGLARIDGSINAGIGFEIDTCNVGDCPTVMILELDLAALRISGAGGDRFVEIDGAATLRDPIAVDAPSTIAGDFAITTHRGSASLVTETTYAVGADDCVSLASEARAEIDGAGAELGLVAFAATGVERCPQSCPRTGDVEISYDAGALLAWSYTGEPTVAVIGPRGKEAEVALACGLE